MDVKWSFYLEGKNVWRIGIDFYSNIWYNSPPKRAWGLHCRDFYCYYFKLFTSYMFVKCSVALKVASLSNTLAYECLWNYFMQTIPNLQWFNLSFYDFLMVQKQYAVGWKWTWNSEFHGNKLRDTWYNVLRLNRWQSWNLRYNSKISMSLTGYFLGNI